jgi:5-methylcytosine-specific restriction endonuclease McrA
MNAVIILCIGIVLWAFKQFLFEIKRRRRQAYYRDVYLKSDEWQRKRYVVLRRDNWCCVYCGERATEVHHKKYAKYNIGREPIKWLVSVCKNCHESIHD